MKKIGLFGGTFDPVHIGHLIIAELLCSDLQLDEVWFIPSKIHPLKNNRNISNTNHRVKMLELALAGSAKFSICRAELQKTDTSYTVDTIQMLKRKYAGAVEKFYFFLGMDNLLDLHRWKAPEQLLEICQVVAFGRPGFEANRIEQQFLKKIQFAQMPLLEISSTNIRDREKQGKSIRFLVPETVNNYIKTNGLYT